MEDRSSSSKVPAELKWSKNMEDNQKGFIQHFVSIRQCCKWKGGESRCISDSNRILHALHVRVCCSLLATRITKNLGYTKWSHIACCIKLGAGTDLTCTAPLPHLCISGGSLSKWEWSPSITQVSCTLCYVACDTAREADQKMVRHVEQSSIVSFSSEAIPQQLPWVISASCDKLAICTTTNGRCAGHTEESSRYSPLGSPFCCAFQGQG